MLKKNKKKFILGICLILALMLIFFVYLKLTLQDKFFPYWDPYSIKITSEKVGTAEKIQISEPLFFYNAKIFHQITNLDYYYIIKYGNFFFIFFLFFILYLFFREIIKSKKKSEKALIIISLIYFFLCWYTFLRFSMTLRENLVISLGFIFIYLLTKFDRKDKLSYSNIVLLSLIYAYIIAAHMIVSFVITGVVGFYFLSCLIKKKNIKQVLSLIVLTVIISFPFLYHQYGGIVYQLQHGQEIVERQGRDVSYHFIKSSYFNPRLDILLVLGGLIFFAIAFKKNKIKNYRIFLFYLATISIMFFVSYIPQFGSKQNRFAIYIYIILSFFLFFLLKWFRNLSYNKIIIPLILISLFITMIPEILDYHGYRPINERNINYIDSQIPYLQQYSQIYCGNSVSTILTYLDYNNICISFRKNIDKLPQKLDRPLVIVYDDYILYKTQFPKIFKKLENFQKNNKQMYDRDSRTWIILPN